MVLTCVMAPLGIGLHVFWGASDAGKVILRVVLTFSSDEGTNGGGAFDGKLISSPVFQHVPDRQMLSRLPVITRETVSRPGTATTSSTGVPRGSVKLDDGFIDYAVTSASLSALGRQCSGRARQRHLRQVTLQWVFQDGQTS